ncbi:hypothetical protein EV401DRAFT_2066179 [Pisolithus croceorrhizus]|nr:hypothetical protein EV401DRAFT_2066179 [Pisolithus croceorrhizus]
MSHQTSARFSGLSKSVSLHGFRGRVRRTRILQAGRQAARLHSIDEQRVADLQMLAVEDQDAVDRMLEDQGMDIQYQDAVPFSSLDSGTDSENDDEFSGLSKTVSGWRRVDNRDRGDRIDLQVNRWDAQMPNLVDAYLDFCSRNPDDGFSAEEPIEDLAPTDHPPCTVSGIELVDIFARRKATLIARPQHIFPNENLIYHRYLGCSPVYPAVAFSLRTLSVFQQARRACPRFSIHAQCKMLCYLHNVPYRPYLFQQLTHAFDVYLEILHRVDQKIQAALNHNTREWRLRNECPACFYRIEDEPKLPFDWLVSIDGNNSLKRWDPAAYGTVPRADHRTARSSYWLSNEEVDKFKYEVKAKQERRTDLDTEIYDDDWWVESSDVTREFNCIDRWRNARPDVQKKSFDVFKESGIFIATCCHRFVLLACDMIKSGELAKYPLAIINSLLSAYGPNGGCAYDIGCAFAKTANSSSIGARLDWHPMYIEGAGNMEGEGCEHVFSAFNELARSTRHATRFHRHQTIEEHFVFWNQDKYEALTRFIWNHYREATYAIRHLESELAVLKTALNLTDEDFPRFLAEERVYLTSLKQPPFQDAQRIRYVQVLDDLEERRAEWNTARGAANAALSGVVEGDYSAMAAAVNQARIRVELAYARLQNTEALAAHIQGQLGLELPWKVGGEDYNCYKEEVTLGKYCEALGELEQLVVMRLFELSKLGMSGTGYKLRQQISKGLQRRSEAIRKAITRYNIQAGLLNPPRPPISWKDIAQYMFLGEFDLLQHAQDDIREHIWAKPAVREATAKFFKLSIHDEEVEVSQTITKLRRSDPLLAHELHHLHRPRAAVNTIHIHCLNNIEKQYGLVRRGVGTRLQVFGYSNDGAEIPDPASSDDSGAMTSGDVRETPAVEEPPPEEISTFDEIYTLYINDPGDHDLVDDEDDVAGIQSMADFLQDIVD